MSMPLVEYYPLVVVDVDQIPRRAEPPKFTSRAPKNTVEPPKRLDLPLDKTTYFEKYIKITSISLGVMATIIALIKLYVWYENAQVRKKLDDVNRIVNTDSWNEEDPKLIKELYAFVCELRDHQDCKEQKDKLNRIINCFPEPTRNQFEKRLILL